MDSTEFLADLDGGVFASKVAEAIKQAAQGVVRTGKKGQVSITLDMTRLGDSAQVMVAHKLKFVQPTERGALVEDDTTKTPMHVNRDGSVTLFPEAQGDMFSEREGETPA